MTTRSQNHNKLSPTMIETLHHLAYEEMAYEDNPYAFGSVSAVQALVRRNLIVRNPTCTGFELTHIGREKVSDMSGEFAAWWDKVKARTAKCANRWHQVCDANEGTLCPECPSEQDAPTREQADIDDLVGWMSEARTAVERHTPSRRMTSIVKNIIELANRMSREDVITAQDREYTEWAQEAEKAQG